VKLLISDSVDRQIFAAMFCLVIIFVCNTNPEFKRGLSGNFGTEVPQWGPGAKPNWVIVDEILRI